MCIVCHYRGDNRLVSREQRAAEHLEGGYACVRSGVCVDCGALVVEDDPDHLCERIARIQVVGTRTYRSPVKGRA